MLREPPKNSEIDEFIQAVMDLSSIAEAFLNVEMIFTTGKHTSPNLLKKMYDEILAGKQISLQDPSHIPEMDYVDYSSRILTLNNQIATFQKEIPNVLKLYLKRQASLYHHGEKKSQSDISSSSVVLIKTDPSYERYLVLFTTCKALLCRSAEESATFLCQKIISQPVLNKENIREIVCELFVGRNTIEVKKILMELVKLVNRQINEINAREDLAKKYPIKEKPTEHGKKQQMEETKGQDPHEDALKKHQKTSVKETEAQPEWKTKWLWEQKQEEEERDRMNLELLLLWRITDEYENPEKYRRLPR